MKYDFGIRVNVGSNVGVGHFFRCYSIAKKLIEKKINLVFIVDNNEAIKSHLNEENIPVIVLKSSNEKERIKECEILTKDIPNFIIDLPFHNEQYSNFLKDLCKIIIIDDIGNKKIFSDILFNGSIVKQFQKYDIDNNKTKYFSGTEFMILRSEFITFRKNVSIPKNKIQKILLTFGGNDDNDIVRQIIPYFYDKNYFITIVLGPSYSYSKDIEKMVEKNHNFEIVSNSNNMAELFSKQDLVIASSGITVYELACLGIPCILIPSDKYQNETAIEMEKNGFGKNYGLWKKDFMKLDKIIASISEESVREKMHIIGKRLVDGQGLVRVIKIISDL